MSWIQAGLSNILTLKPVQGLYRGRVISESCPICGGWWISPCSAPSAQWGEGRADKVIYLHLSTFCNGWHIHLSLKLHHLIAAPSLAHKGVWVTDETHFREEKGKQTNLNVSSSPHFLIKAKRVWEHDTLHSKATKSLFQCQAEAKMLDGSQL